MPVDRFYFHPTFRGYPEATSYDAAVIDVLADTPSIPVMPVDGVALPEGSVAHMTGYGRDEANSANSGHKQKTSLVTLSESQLRTFDPANSDPVGLLNHFYVFNGGHSGSTPPQYISSADGDSGGPVFVNRTAWGIVGIISFRFDGNGAQPPYVLSAVTRVADIASWIGSAVPARISRSGSITNFLMGKCLTAFKSTSVNSRVGLEPCNGANGTSDTQYWARVANPTSVLLRNGNSRLCLAVNGSGAVVQATCDQNASSQQWSISGNNIFRTANPRFLTALGQDGVTVASQEVYSRQKWWVTP